MAYDLAKVTDAGNNLVASILANKSSLSIDKIEVSDTQLQSTTDITKLTSISDVIQTIQANGFLKNENTLIVSSVLDNSKITADYKAWVFGIWGSDSQNGQSMLMAVITATNAPDTIPAYSGSTPVSYRYNFNIGFSNAGNVQFNMIDDSFATNDTVVHTTGDETIDGQKKFKTDPTDSAGNAYAKTVDVNQQLDKKVNVADMRKPASDVAGIEEVSTLQTQVNNSAVGTNLLLGTSSSEQSYTGDFSTVPSWFNTRVAVNAGSTYTYSIYLTKLTGSFVLGFWKYDSNGAYITWVHSDYYSSLGKVSYTFTVPSGVSYISPHAAHLSDDFACIAKEEKLELGSHATDWCPNPDDKVNVSDMRKPASDVAGIEEVNAKQDKIGYTPADDSKVAHLSGANNFDTVPTVNNNPLLLASSLPSDLARTGQANTFTAAQTFSIAPTIKDASKDKGDNQAATMADLKSVENSAWHTVTLPDSQGLKNITMIYKIHDDEKYIEANIHAQPISSVKASPTMLNLSGIINKITSLDLLFITSYSSMFKTQTGLAGGASTPSFSSNVIVLTDDTYIDYDDGLISITSNGNPNFAKIYYDSLVNN